MSAENLHLMICFQQEVCIEASVRDGHGSNVQLMQKIAVAQYILAADILQQSCLMSIFPKLLLH